MPNIMLAVLAGGAGSRMGRPKGDLVVGDMPVLSFLLKRWTWNGPTMLVTAPAREHPPGFEAFDREVVDPTADQGPLRGIVTALENSRGADVIAIATCDMPLVTTAMLAGLCSALLADRSTLGVMARSADGVEPFPMALRPGAIDPLRARLDRGEFALRAIASLPQFRTIDAPADWPRDVWTNLNNPDDYARFIASLPQQ